jgi:SAM-dependent methyltransferase
MKQPRRTKKPTSADFLDQGNEAFRAGRFYLAAEAFVKAREIDPRNPVVLFNLASARERIGEMDEAAVLLTQSLRHSPSWEDAARRLSMLLGRFRVETAAEFDPHGLLAAFAFKHIDHHTIASAALDHLKAATSLGQAVEQAGAGQADEAARALLLRRTDKVLAEPLLLAALGDSANRDPRLEALLTAMRRVLLLEVPAQRFEDKALTVFVNALIRQCLANEHVFAVSDEEQQHLTESPLDLGRVTAGDADETCRLMLRLLYRSPETLIGKKLTLPEARAIRPRALGDLLAVWSQAEDQRTILGADIPAFGDIEDAVSKKVAGQYEAHPYPQWSSLLLPDEGSAKAGLKRYFPEEKLGFLDRPFTVLIAGCGTGQHAVAAAVRYGPNADVLAIDLSRASLAYAKSKAEQFGVTNLRFAQGDILTADALGEQFDIIEAVGVLHHMAEPFRGWQTLTGILKPGGLMLTGLYSATARRNIVELPSEAEYPGPDCSDDAARAYRRSLMYRDDPGANALLHSHDFYTLSEFRDLVLHEHERPVVISEIEAFLGQNSLEFRGFQLPSPLQAAFAKAYPDTPWPGTLADWSAFEEQHQRLFEAMYQVWCEKAA